MKTTITFALLAMLFTSCANSGAQSSRYATDQFEISEFTEIESSIVGNIEVRQSNKTELTAEGDEDLLDILIVRMDRDKLILEMPERNLNRFNLNNKKLFITITTPALNRVDMEGVGNMTINGTFNTPNLSIDSEGVGNFEAENLKTEFVRINSEGVGNIKVAGETNEAEISSEGIGTIDARNMYSKITKVKLEGVGNISCYASDYLKVNSEGIGSVTYYGNPADTDFSKEGLGKIKSGD